MFLFNKRDVYIGYSLEELLKVREILAKEGIKYTYKVINHSDNKITLQSSYIVYQS